MSKVIVTGGAGAIGYHLCSALAEKGHIVYLIDNYCRSNRDNKIVDLIKYSNVHEIQMDLSNLSEYDKIPRDIDYVYHLAAMNGTQNFYERPFDVLVNCTIPTIYLLKHLAHDKSLKRFIYAGSSEAYASTVSLFDWEVPTKETVPLCIADPTNVRWSYGGSKLHGELATIAASHQLKTPYTILRFHNVYGPRMGNKHVIPDFLERAKKGIYELYGHEDTRSFIYVDDAIRAAIQCCEADSMLNQTVNIGGEEEISIQQLGEKIMEILNKKEKITCFPSPKGSVHRRSPDLSLLQELVGFKANISLEEGLKRVISDIGI